MNRKRIAIIQGHPDQSNLHYCHTIAHAYEKGARDAGHITQTVEAASLSTPFLSNQLEFNTHDIDSSILNIQGLILWADHIVTIYPLWLGTMPALLKHFFEQIFRPRFAFFKTKGRMWPIKILKGKCVRVVVTMRIPAIIYRWFYRAHSLKSLEQNILYFVGLKPVYHSLIGQIDTASERNRLKWLKRMKKFGEACI
jgi:putative NADPH-quinone reductase